MDQTIRFPDGIAKDILVKIQDDYVPADFMILDMGIDEEIPLILGRPFLNTTNAVIYVGSGQIHFQFPGWKVKCAFNGYTTNKQVKKNHPNRRRRSTLHRRNQLRENKEEKQVEKEEPATSKSNSKPRKVWRKKVASSSESPPLEVPLQEPLSPGSNEEQFEEKSNSEDLKHRILAER